MNMSAREIKKYAEDAVGDISSDLVQEFKTNGKCSDPEFTTELKKLKKNGVSDLVGALADHMYNQESFLEDMLGDKIYESAPDEEGRLKLVSELRGMANFPSWNHVIEKFMNQPWK